MDAMIGKYKIRMDKNQFVITHPAGISFDLSLEETQGLLDFLLLYQQTLSTMLRDTEPRMERIVIEKKKTE